MNINELEELANIWMIVEDEEDSDYAKSFLELLAAYREAVAVIHESFALCDDFHDDPPPFHKMSNALATAKRLGVE